MRAALPTKPDTTREACDCNGRLRTRNSPSHDRVAKVRRAEIKLSPAVYTVTDRDVECLSESTLQPECKPIYYKTLS